MFFSKLFLVTASDSSEHGADILVIDDQLLDVMEPVTQSGVNQHDAYSANHMVVLPDQVRKPDYMMQTLLHFYMTDKKVSILL